MLSAFSGVIANPVALFAEMYIREPFIFNAVYNKSITVIYKKVLQNQLFLKVFNIISFPP